MEQLHEHRELFFKLRQLGLHQKEHLAKLLECPQGLTLIKIVLLVGLEKVIANCLGRQSVVKLKMAEFFRLEIEAITEGLDSDESLGAVGGIADEAVTTELESLKMDKLKDILKKAACAFHQKSGLFTAQSYQVAKPYFEVLRELFGISDVEWQSILAHKANLDCEELSLQFYNKYMANKDDMASPGHFPARP
ncbi:hypothetical protein [Piscirickettsia salmonis]|uniref:hypothetical protein n=1 Tax=Piscirickettsia salmonis TaxID=1238 RepID=UPI0012BAAAB4|nr:hypothetical protein [Piscirickettsia salmonis]